MYKRLTLNVDVSFSFVIQSAPENGKKSLCYLNGMPYYKRCGFFLKNSKMKEIELTKDEILL